MHQPFAVRELGYQKVLFLVHRNQIAEQTLKSYQKSFLGRLLRWGLVTGKSHDYSADFYFLRQYRHCQKLKI